VLLPFGDRIIYDSLIAPYNVHFGPGIRRDLEQKYRDAKERGAIITSLLPSGPASGEAKQEAAGATNVKVVNALRTHLFRAGLSPRVVERDLGNVIEFADVYLAYQPGAPSLREFDSKMFRAYVEQVRAAPGLTAAKRRETLTSLKRLIQFLRDTERRDYSAAARDLAVLKGGD
jgi:hypothetical protein